MELPVKAPPVSGAQKTSYRLETKNLSYKLCSKLDELHFICCGGAPRRAPRFILRDVNCAASPGEITAIAGPSGAGKTTLLEILSGKISPRKVSGQVLVNSQPMNVRHFRRISGLPGGKKDAANRVRRLLSELGLEHAEGSNCGISGGEKRRVSIGVDLVHDPAVVFIDEPTSGLDSASALHVATLLKSMVLNQGKTIVLTIHQPGFRILELFDRLVLLSNGYAVHNGSLHFLEERLKFSGHQIPPHVNVLEFSFDAIESLSGQNSAFLNNQCPREIRHNGSGHIARTPYFNNHQEKPLRFPRSILEEVSILGQRFCSNIFRTKQLFATRVIQSLVAGLILGTIFLNVGKKTGQVALQTRIGFFAFSLTFLLSSTTEGLPIFLQERRILMSETSRGAYRVSSYVLSNTLIFIPFLLMVALLYSTPVYWLVGLRMSIHGFLYFTLVVWMVILMSNSFVACFSALVPNFIMGTSVISGLMGSFFLFSGYFITKSKIPSYWVFMHYLSLFKYPFECFLINEYGGEQGYRRCLVFDKEECILYGSGFLRQQGLRDSQKWSNLAVMFGFIIGYRVLCFVILWFRCCRRR
uniref:ABC transporter domain-containing protein n=1 Tax=Salix viminalis TaxID=40686 RepID=A0A6N2NLA7_SALVM